MRCFFVQKKFSKNINCELFIQFIKLALMKRISTVLFFSLAHFYVMAQMTVHKSVYEQKDSLNYILYTPKDTLNDMPLVVFLHGGGEGGTEIELVKKHGLPKLISEGKDFPF